MRNRDRHEPTMTGEEFFAMRARRMQIMTTVNERLSQLHAYGVPIDDDAAPAFHRELHAREQASQ